ncbi:spore germination protein [Lihuaxuella thermophila]|uniref:Germination protein, Ger(X)C family n=1 Tax=Lihuaxuella thermophila TaxID=1173111 RepID=A0A1H8E9A6_9BACL|nr:spore germination protein [Lihuaxuella thermophila]SEN16085.1 germination protein, Ger(x)C family [Lihuaxuella thermophila]
MKDGESAMRRLRIRGKKQSEETAKPTEKKTEFALFSGLEENMNKIREEFGGSPDCIIRTFEPGCSPGIQVALVYIESLVNRDTIHEWVMKSLMIDSVHLEQLEDERTALEWLKKNALTIGKIEWLDSWAQVYESILTGNAVLFGEGWSRCIAVHTAGGASKPVSEPTSQTVIRGPKDSFTESIDINIGLIRRRIKTPNLWMTKLLIGSLTKTEVAVMYIQGIANENIVKKVLTKLKAIEIDAILESGYIEEFIQHKTFTPFPTLYSTERPDVIAGNLLEGRVAILVDNTPYVLTVPATFPLFFQSVEDYYQRFDISLLLRLIRYAAFLVSLLTPSVYIALTTFHQEMVPTNLLINIAAQREGVPFPVVVEVLLMELVFEVIREAGVRAPKALSTAVTIVGAIVLGETAIRSGMVTPATVIVVATTAIANFVNPSFNMAIAARLLRFALILLAAVFGLFGIVLALIVLIPGIKLSGDTTRSQIQDILKKSSLPYQLSINGIAVFKNGRLIRWLSGSTARGVAFIRDQISTTSVYVQCGKRSEGATVDLIKSITQISAQVKQNKPVFRIRVDGEAAVEEMNCPMNLEDPANLEILEKKVSRTIAEEINAAVRTAQKVKSDFLGLGEMLHHENPAAWKQYEKKWPQLFSTAQIEVHVHTFIRRTGLRTNSYIELERSVNGGG